MAVSFVPDSMVSKIAEAYANDAVDLAARSFQTKLDWTDESVRLVEEILEKLRASMPTPKPPDDVIWSFAKGFGSYVGEVFRKNHGGEWGMVTQDWQTFPGIRWKGNVLFWPWGRVHQRIVVGAENNVFDYYRSIVSA
jgi:hypothetical protein